MMADPHLLTAWATALWRACWQGGVALLLVWVVCAGWKTMPPRVREWLWRLAYAKLLVAWLCAGMMTLKILPAMPYAPAPHLPAFFSALPVQSDPSPAPVVQVDIRHPAAPALIPPSRPVPSRHWQFADFLWLLAACWVLGVAAGLLRLGLGLRQMQRLRREARPVRADELLRLHERVATQMGLPHAPLLLAHPTEGPLLHGYIHPLIIIPEAMVHGELEPFQLALAHELAHIRRRDILWGWLPALVELLFFFHPLVYPARRECRLAQEIACDALALDGTGASPRDYGAMLVHGATHRAGYRPVPVAVGIFESFHTLQRRLIAMKRLHTLSRRQQLLTGLLLGALALLGLFPWRLSAADDLANLQNVPPPRQPVPNARVIYQKAVAKLVHKLPDLPFDHPVDYEDIYTMSLQHITPGVGMETFSHDTIPVPTLEEMQALMQANQPAFEQLRQGFNAEYCELPVDSFHIPLPHLAQFRSVARLLAAATYTCQCNHDWSGALQYSLDGMRLGEDVPHGGVLISLLVGNAIQNIARQQVWEIVPHLSAAEAAAGAARLEAIMARHVPLAESMREQKRCRELGLRELYRDPQWKKTYARDLTSQRAPLWRVLTK